MNAPIRHVLGISGGKDSAALAVYMRHKIPDMEYFFCDTMKELPETYEFLSRLEAYLEKPIVRLNAVKGFDHWLKVYGGYLPSSRMRWCTRQLKIKPFEEWIGDAPCRSYIAIRADENREGYISNKPNIIPIFPFKEDGIIRDDVYRILDECGVGLPKYYSWRTRSGCYFCFFQRKIEWVGLKENHPKLFELAKNYEKPREGEMNGYSWCDNETLDELVAPERVAEIRRRHSAAMERERKREANRRLVDVFDDALDDEDDELTCLLCHI